MSHSDPKAPDTRRHTAPLDEVLRSQARLRALVESDAVTMWTTDPDGNVEDMPGWRRLTGQTLDEVRGAGWVNAIHPDDRASTLLLWETARAAHGTYQAEYRLRLADGEYRWHQARGVPVLGDDGEIREWAGTLHDVHERRKVEEERDALLHRLQVERAEAEAHADSASALAAQLQEQAAETELQMAEAQTMAEELEATNEQLAAAHAAAQAALEDEARLVETLHRIGVSLTGETELSRIVQAATDEATVLTAAQFGAFFYNVVGEAGEAYTLYTISGVPREAFERFPMPRNTAVFAPTFHGEGVVRSGDIREDPRYGHSAPYHGMPQGHLPVRSYLAVPVMGRTGEVLGGLFFGHAQPDVFTERAERLAVGIAGWASVAIENARLHEAGRRAREAAERAAERAQRLLEVAGRMARALSPREVAEVAVEHGMHAIGADAGSMALLDEAGTEFAMAGSHGYPGPSESRFRHFPVRAGAPMSEAVLRLQPVLVRDTAEWRERFPRTAAAAAETGFEGYAAVPIAADGPALGALGFSFREPQAFDAGVEVFLETLAGHCASALERARLYEAERAARAEAEHANRAKSQFLASMSHELRTPLNAIGGYVELIELGLRGPVTPQQATDLGRVKRAQQHLLGLINDVLNFARLEAGKIALDLRDVPLSEVLDEVEALIEPQAAERGIRYERGAGEGEVLVRADREKLEQVLLNLLSNAVKFTDQGGSVSLDYEADAAEVRVRVRDTGCGIPEEKVKAVFEPFVQVDPDLTRTRQGTGLGLAISRELARAMGGDVTVRSVVDEGSTFTVHLPAAEVALP
ncbi:MAG TPA: ATP-binding protein [Longimicrobium sp.]|jgi:PAS domain S-box-containing protein|uniref:sensor histidine kinase n=1 Tax=Longimicrobium sp. TaxID=2029185 RepID=UPI002EDAD1EB